MQTPQGHDIDPVEGGRLSPVFEPVALTVREERFSAFYPMLQRGVTMLAVTGCPLQELLCDQIGIPADYVSGRITTIFLDSRPLDNLAALVAEGARIALSAAMPGLVGAVMRRSGFYAALRQGITHAERSGGVKPGAGTVTVKLFNLLLPEIGPLILAHGVILTRAELEAVLVELGETGSTRISSLAAHGRDPEGKVLVTVRLDDGE